MKLRNRLILGLALVLALSISMPGGAQAQQIGPADSYGLAGPDYGSGYYNHPAPDYAGPYCPMSPGYYRPRQGYQNYDSRPWGQSRRGSRGPWNSGYAGGYRGGWGYCW